MVRRAAGNESGGMSTYAVPQTRTGAGVFGRVMSLVGVAIAFLAAGAVIGRDLALGTAQALGFIAIAMLFAQSFVAGLRRGGLGLTWLFGLALILGISLGPVLQTYVTADPDAVIQAAGATALTTLAMGAWGLATSADLSRWLRPLSFAMLGLFVVGLLLLLFGAAGNPLFSLVVIAVSAALLVVDFNYVRNRAGDDDVIWLATGIFVSIVNLFISFLNLFGGRG
jgi:modulator of FtsH protease